MLGFYLLLLLLLGYFHRLYDGIPGTFCKFIGVVGLHRKSPLNQEFLGNLLPV
jgi:hypothetical protein